MPEPTRFIGELMIFWWDEFWCGHQWGKIKEELGFGGWVALSEGVIDFVMPRAFETGEDVCFGNFFDFSVLLVLRRVVGVDDALDSILGLAEPTFIQIMQDYPYACLGACDVTSVCYCD